MTHHHHGTATAVPTVQQHPATSNDNNNNNEFSLFHQQHRTGQFTNTTTTDVSGPVFQKKQQQQQRQLKIRKYLPTTTTTTTTTTAVPSVFHNKKPLFENVTNTTTTTTDNINHRDQCNSKTTSSKKKNTAAAIEQQQQHPRQQTSNNSNTTSSSTSKKQQQPDSSSRRRKLPTTPIKPLSPPPPPSGSRKNHRLRRQRPTNTTTTNPNSYVVNASSSSTKAEQSFLFSPSTAATAITPITTNQAAAASTPIITNQRKKQQHPTNNCFRSNNTATNNIDGSSTSIAALFQEQSTIFSTTNSQKQRTTIMIDPPEQHTAAAVVADLLNEEENYSSVVSKQHSSATTQQQQSTHDHDEEYQSELSYTTNDDDDDDDDATFQLTNGGYHHPIHTTTASPKRQKTKLNERLRQALARPFGQILSEEVPVNQQQQQYVVEISAAEWDGNTMEWKYRILVQCRDNSASQSSSSTTKSSFTKAFIVRSITDFYWLETSVRNEYHGSILLPPIETTTSSSSDVIVSQTILKTWLSDLLNHTRGNYEWEYGGAGFLLDLLVDSTSMDTFLYSHTIPPLLTTNNIKRGDSVSTNTTTSMSEKSIQSQHPPPKQKQPPPQSMLSAFLEVVLTPIDICVGSSQVSTQTTEYVEHGCGLMDCTTTSTVSTDTTDSTMKSNAGQQTTSASPPVSGGGNSIVSNHPARMFTQHSQLLTAQHDLVLSYRDVAASCLQIQKQLQQREERANGAWKRFAVSLGNLFAYEKDAETAKLGTELSVHKDNMPFRKVSKSNVEEQLQQLVQAKLGRAQPSLDISSTMISSYHADLRAVEPSVIAFAKSVAAVDTKKPLLSSSSSSAAGDSKSAASEVVERWEQSGRVEDMEALDALIQQHSHRSSFTHPELHTHEKHLRASITAMLLSIPFRTARVAWRYFHTEATQCIALNSAASALKSKVDIVSQKSVSKMLKRHAKTEKTDAATEMDLIHKIVRLGHTRKFDSPETDDNTDGSVSISTLDNDLTLEVDTGDINQGRVNAMKRDKALDMARHRIGRWDAALAMSIMEAVGADDPDVRVDETTKELRLIRKYAIGLRETLNRCVESLHVLHEAVTGNRSSRVSSSAILPQHQQQSTTEDSSNELKELRSKFLHELSKLCSCSFADEKTPQGRQRVASAQQVLTSMAGIETSDPCGWIPINLSQRDSCRSVLTEGRVGELALRYGRVRDAQVEWLLTSLLGLLNEYYQRVETVESFVFMECVGIQIEKHFSSKRTALLSDFDKKADISAAYNIANRKRREDLKTELQARMDALGPNVTHTAVKEAKEAHLVSKTLKVALHELAVRRLSRARETSTERVVTMISLWAKEEELCANEEIKAIGETMVALERAVCQEDDNSSQQQQHPPNNNIDNVPGRSEC